jgi:hypothetical protein
MPLEQARYTLETLSNVCAAQKIALSSYPMHEVLFHPDPSGILALFSQFNRPDYPFEPLATTGVPLSLRPDWREILLFALQSGTKTLWLTFHGLDSWHDMRVGLKGAFHLSHKAIERSISTSIACGANIILTREMLNDVPELLRVLTAAGVKEFCVMSIDYSPIARIRDSEDSRPALAQLSPLREQLAGFALINKSDWAGLEQCTESVYYQRALSGSWPETTALSDKDKLINAVVKPNLDVHKGRAGLYGKFCGNLRADGGNHVLASLLAGEHSCEEELYFSTQTIPSIAEAAKAVGDPNGLKVYHSQDSMRRRWLDMALASSRRF